MKTLWIIAFFLASFGVYAKAQDSVDYDDYYNYDNFEDIEKKLDEEISKLNEKTDIDNDLKVEEDIQQFRESDKNAFDAVDEPIETIDNVEDGYQEDKKEIVSDNDGSLENNGDKLKKPANELENRPDEESAFNHNKDYALLWGDDSVAPLPVPEISENDENKDIIEETQKILEEDADNFEEEIKKEIGDLELKSDDQPNLGQIVDETRKLLSESDDSFSDDTLNKKNDAASFENVNKDNNDQDVVEKKDDADEDTVDKAYADLNADLDKLFATLDKLKDDGSENDSHGDDFEKALDEADKLFEDNKNDLDNTNVEGSEELTDDNNDDDTVDLDKLLEDILSENDMKPEDSAAEDLTLLINDALNEPNPDDAFVKDVESLDAKLKPILYLNDALVDESKDAETGENKAEDNDSKENANASVEKEPEVKTALVDDLTSAEMEDLVSQFSVLHSEDLDVRSGTFDKNVAPVHLTLKLEEPTIITSPDHPNPYPTNNIVDWIIEGEGMGIELNITEFAVNGALGDYLLIKPGGIDDSGHEGLLFTYRLTSERRYRFTDVDRLFMRFESKLGMQFFRGFVISAKMIAPLRGEPEPVPEPEAVVLPPYATTTLYLAVPVHSFREIREDFRQILVDMTSDYIIEQQLTSAALDLVSNITQITGVDLCPMSWPHYEGCSAVTFGVTAVVMIDDDDKDLKLDEDDLQDMWDTFSRRDPYALRLSRMGISEFDPPSSAALTAWLVIAAGVVISMAMLALVLWRYSCFEDYTRMKTYSDTDSLHNEKRNLDLYPTPHQTLPPLYAQNEYKWQEDDATRVDMGGFANRSYAQENMYDFESDEEVVTARDRNGVSPANDHNCSDV